MLENRKGIGSLCDFHWHNHCQSAAGFDHRNAMDEKRRPRTCQLVEFNSLARRTRQRQLARLASETLISNEWRIADDYIYLTGRDAIELKEIGLPEVSFFYAKLV